MTTTYPPIKSLGSGPLVNAASHTLDRLARLNERLRTSPLASGLNARLGYMEACASAHAEGDLVQVEDLVLFDAGVFTGPVCPALSRARHTLQAWRRAQDHPAAALLDATPPGDPRDSQAPPGDISQSALSHWRSVLRQAVDLPPPLIAAIAWDAWRALDPAPDYKARAPLLAALTLKTRQEAADFLLPINTGRRLAKYRTHPAHTVGSASDRLPRLDRRRSRPRRQRARQPHHGCTAHGDRHSPPSAAIPDFRLSPTCCC